MYLNYSVKNTWYIFCILILMAFGFSISCWISGTAHIGFTCLLST